MSATRFFYCLSGPVHHDGDLNGAPQPADKTRRQKNIRNIPCFHSAVSQDEMASEYHRIGGWAI